MRSRPTGLLSVLWMLVAALPLTAQSLPDRTIKHLEACIHQRASSRARAVSATVRRLPRCILCHRAPLQCQGEV